jgi:hypothetical protein
MILCIIMHHIYHMGNIMHDIVYNHASYASYGQYHACIVYNHASYACVCVCVCGGTFLSLKLTFLSINLTFLSLNLTFLSLNLTFLSLNLTFLSLNLTFLSMSLCCHTPPCKIRNVRVCTVCIHITVKLRIFTEYQSRTLETSKNLASYASYGQYHA